MTTSKHYVYSAWLVLLLVAVPVVVAQPAFLGKEFLVDSAAGARLRTPEVAADSWGRFLIVWDDPKSGLAARVLTPEQEAVSPQLRLVGNDSVTVPFYGQAHSAIEPLAVLTGRDRFVLVWTREYADLTVDVFYESRRILDQDILAQAFDLSGAPLDEPVRVNTTEEGLQSRARATILPKVGLLVVWQSTKGESGDSDGVFARIIRRSVRQAASSEIRVDDVPGSGGVHPAVAASPAGQFLITWDACCDDSGDRGIFARLYDRLARPLGPPFQVNTHSVGNQGVPAVAASRAGEFVILWQTPTGEKEGHRSVYRVFGQTISPEGGFLGPEFQASGGPGWAHASPALAVSPSGGMLAVWLAWKGDIFYDVFGQRMDSAGPVGGEPVRISEGPLAGQWRISLAAGGQEDFLATWAGYDQDGKQAVIARRVALSEQSD